MNRRLCFVLIGVLGAIGLWLGTRSGTPARETAIRTKAGSSSRDAAAHADGSGAVRTKVAAREFDATRYTHSPERLREFMLPAMAIDGLNLDAALKKLMATYEDACRISGEMPLPLTFTMPPGATRKLTVHLPAGNFKTSVQLLAALSGMKASRRELEYRFEPMANERKSVNRNLQVPSNFRDALNEMAGLVSAPSSDPFASPGSNDPKPIQECLDVLGRMDSSTHVSLGPSGELKLETMNATDAAVISELVRSIGEVPPMQLKGEARIMELPVGSDWTPPDDSRMTDSEIDRLMRDFAQTKGLELQTLPSVTSRNGQNATIEIIAREFIYPTDDSGTKFEQRDAGKVLEMQGNFLGFGHDVALKYTDTTGGIDSSTGMPIFDRRTEMADRNYKDDGGTKLVVQIRPDGSRTVLLFKSQTIDATGRPIH